MISNEKDLKIFKKWLKSHLAYGPTTITFIKKDGTERSMNCTINEGYIPEELHQKNDKKEKKINDEVMPVYVLDVKGWRSFRWDSVKTITFTLS